MNADTTPTTLQQVTVLLLRVTTGFLLIWWGLAKAFDPSFGALISDNFYGGSFSVGLLQRSFGVLQALIGLLVVVGLFRFLVLPAQLLINGFTAAAVWWAIVDPFYWYLPGDKPFQFAHLFYPSAIVVAACLVLIAFRSFDRLALDALRRRRTVSTAHPRPATALH